MNSLVNFRDIGNVLTMNGTLVKPGLFLRSGEVVDLEESATDKLLNEYHLKIIVDFRGESEMKESPDDTLKGVGYVNIDILKDTEGEGQGAGFEDLLKGAGKAEETMFTLYEEFVLAKSAQEGYQKFLEMVLDTSDLPILFHCFAGKDRTGFAAAIILKSLGVSDDLIMKDYLKTNEMRKVANKPIIDDLRKKGLTEEQLNEVLVMLNVDQRYLEHSFEIIKKEYGSFEGYITDGLNMPETFFDEMKNKFTI